MLKAVAAAAAMGMVAALGAMAPASAETGRSDHATLTTVGGFVGPDACQEGPPEYQLDVDEASVSYYDDWSADITITGPGGYYATDFLWEDEGWNKVFFCESPNRPGTYTVSADVEIDHSSDYDYWTTYETVSTTFQVTGKSSSAVSYTKKTYRAHGWKFPIKVSRAGRAWPNKSVTMQFKACGGWHKVLTKQANSYGRVTFWSTPSKRWNRSRTCRVLNRKIPFRFYVAGDYRTKASRSTTFHISRR